MAGERVDRRGRSREPRAPTRSARRRAAPARRSRRAWASRSRTRACSTRRSACWPRRISGRPSSRSSTRSGRRSPSSSNSRRSSSSSANGSGTLFDARARRTSRLYDRGHGPDPLPVRDREGRRAIHTRAVRARHRAHLRRHPTPQAAPAPDRGWRRRGARGDPVSGSADRVVARRPDPGRRPGHRRHRSREHEPRRLRRRATSAAHHARLEPGVALENARLFDETQRLLAETDERAAELAIINSVQQGLAAQLDMQAMYDLVGDKIQEIFDAQVVDIGIYDLDDGRRPLPVHDRARASASRTSRRPFERADASSSSQTRAPVVVINDVLAWDARHRRGVQRSSRASREVRSCCVPLIVAARSAAASRCRTSTARTRSATATSDCSPHSPAA